MANAHRGEVKIRLAEKEFTLRPTLDAIAQSEDDIRGSLIALARRAGQMDVRHEEAIAVFYRAAHAVDRGVSRETMADAVVSAGMFQAVPELIRYLTAALRPPDAGGDEAPADDPPQ